MEQALHDLERASRAAERGAPQEGLSLLREYPLTAELLAVSQLWTDQRSGARLVATKGAPEAIVDLCHLDPTRMAVLDAGVIASGEYESQLAIPNVPSLVGLRIYGQGVVLTQSMTLWSTNVDTKVIN